MVKVRIKEGLKPGSGGWRILSIPGCSLCYSKDITMWWEGINCLWLPEGTSPLTFNFIFWIILWEILLKSHSGRWDCSLHTFHTSVKNPCTSRAWWHTPLIPALGRQRQADFWVRGQPALQSEFQDSQGYKEKPCLETPPPKKKKRILAQDIDGSPTWTERLLSSWENIEQEVMWLEGGLQLALELCSGPRPHCQVDEQQT
jgi:hypothetical protein